MDISSNLLEKLVGLTAVVVYEEMGQELAVIGKIDEVNENTVIINTERNTYFININKINKIKIKRGD